MPGFASSRFTDAELEAEESMSSNDYDGDGPSSGNFGYHYDPAGDEVIIERQIFQRFMKYPHAHEHSY